MSSPFKKSDKNNEGRLVYSSDPTLNKKCGRCKEVVSECTCEPELGLAAAKAYRFIAILSIEKGGRGGKTVTVIDQLPKSELFLKELTTELKKKCGSGGTYLMDGKEGQIEIQGDKREQIRAYLVQKGIQFKG